MRRWRRSAAIEIADELKGQGWRIIHPDDVEELAAHMGYQPSTLTQVFLKDGGLGAWRSAQRLPRPAMRALKQHVDRASGAVPA